MSEEGPKLELTGSRQLTSWLAEQRISLAFTTYQAGKFFLIGLDPSGRLSISERTFSRCMGLTADEAGRTLWMSSLYQLWRFENALLPGQVPSTGHDRLYVPQVGYTTGDIDIHDLAIDRQGRPIFVNTLFSCLATTSETHSFTPLWKPIFISTGDQLYRPYSLARLAEALGKTGQVDEGLSALDEAIDSSRRFGVPYWDAELQRRKGELLLAANDATPVAAEAC